MKELLAKLPAEIAEKLKAETITEEEIKEYVLPLAEKYANEIKDEMILLSDEQLEEVSGGEELGTVQCIIVRLFYKPGHPLKKPCRERGWF